MNFPLQVEGFEGQTIVVQTPGLISGASLLVNGQPAQKGKKRGELALRRSDGREVTVNWVAARYLLSRVVVVLAVMIASLLTDVFSLMTAQ
jgi:hypothetical protein